MSGTVHPAGLTVWVEAGGNTGTYATYTVTTPAMQSVAFAWGTNNVAFTPSGGISPTFLTVTAQGFVAIGNAVGYALLEGGTGAVGNQTIHLPDTPTADTLVGRASIDTLTNKRVNPRTTTINAPGATPTVATDTYDLIAYTGLAAAITSITVTGTPVLGQKLMVGLKDNGTARAITWGASFKSSGAATLLATTVAGKQHWVGLMYDGSAWACLAVDPAGY